MVDVLICRARNVVPGFVMCVAGDTDILRSEAMRTPGAYLDVHKYFILTTTCLGGPLG